MLGSDREISCGLAIALIVVVALVSLAPVASWMTRPAAVNARPGDPYRAAPPASVARSRSARLVAPLVGLAAVGLILSVPIELALMLFSAMSLAGPGDETASAFDLLAAVVALVVGPALVVVARRLGSGAPTTRINSAAAAVLAFALAGGSALATAYAPNDRPLSVALGVLVALVGVALAACILSVREPPRDHAALLVATQRIAGSTILLALLLSVGTVLIAMIADELGDRASSRGYDLDWYAQMQPIAWIAVGACAVGVLVAAAVAFVAVRASRSLARERAIRVT